MHETPRPVVNSDDACGDVIVTGKEDILCGRHHQKIFQCFTRQVKGLARSRVYKLYLVWCIQHIYDSQPNLLDSTILQNYKIEEP